MGTQGPDAHHPVSLQLDSRVCDRRTDSHQLPVPPARRQHQEGRDRRIPQSAQGTLEPATAGYLGWIAGASQPIGTRVLGQLGRPYPNRVPAAVRAGHESGRIPVGLAQTPCAGQLLSEQSRGLANNCAQQAQECAEASFDHRRLLDAGDALVMS